jgi:hypothetical protein
MKGLDFICIIFRSIKESIICGCTCLFSDSSGECNNINKIISCK